MNEHILRAKRGEKRISSQTMSGIGRSLALYTDRFIVDRTGITGNFNVYLEFAPDDVAGNPAFLDARETADSKGVPTAPGLFKALEEQLGLKLEPATGPRGYIQIDHIERPTPDPPSPTARYSRGFGGQAAQPPARAKGAGR